ncbi:TetR/AcrR family transcriptional regulator [Planomonospora sp. ID82291]|uniref:TetR/AcrR family transcriptional regulator n=1 Tax=Planomonospora sp. ID82291 TaxID=2738136 RepID=UPI0018C37E84|nr:TetR/AcrR family transcriptional regulator [Planomonospora sp. ID82291]MBG0817910.1 TetR/AcrR family transcriptional regulator [Planomonospora sp. ID82291]
MEEGTGRTARKHAQILQAATAAFLRHGYAGTSMDEVAASAAVSKQTIYKHFGDKEQLFTRIVLDTTGQVDALVRLVTRTLAGTEDLDRDLAELAHRFIAALMHPELLALRRLVIAEAERFPDVGAAWYRQGFERVLAALADCFERLAGRGLLSVDDPALAADHFVGLLLWIPVNRVMFCGGTYQDDDLPRLADAATRTFLAAYRQGASSPARSGAAGR